MRSTPRRRPASNTPSSTTRSSATTPMAASRGGNIRTAFLYRTDRVDLVDGSLRTHRRRTAPPSPIRPATPTSRPIPTIRSSTRGRRWSRPSPSTAKRSRSSTTTSPRRAAAARFYGSDQPPFNAGEVQRAAQAQAVNNFVDSLLAGDPDAKVIVAGDLNDFEFEEPLAGAARARPASRATTCPASDPFDGDGDLHAGRHRGPPRPAGHCCRRTSATTTCSRAMPRRSTMCW